MPHVEISEETQDRLNEKKKRNETTDDVIRRLLDNFDRNNNPGRKNRNDNPGGKTDPILPPYVSSFTNSTIMEAIIDGKPARKLSWNNLIWDMLIIINEKGYEIPDDIKGLRIYRGKRRDKGYKPIPAINTSVQHVDANNAARILSILSKEYKIPMKLYVSLVSGEKVKVL